MLHTTRLFSLASTSIPFEVIHGCIFLTVDYGNLLVGGITGMVSRTYFDKRQEDNIRKKIIKIKPAEKTISPNQLHIPPLFYR
jgi:hypothetical protein